MSVQSFTEPQPVKSFKLGRTPPAFDAPRLLFNKYLANGLPEPPANGDYSRPAMKSIQQVYMNDQLGDCVIAGGFHLRGVTSGNGNGGSPVIFSNGQAVQQYSAIGGYVPGRPSTDNGCDEIKALQYWQRIGFPDGVKLTGYVNIDGANRKQCMTALWLFENLIFGMAMPNAWISPFPSRSGFVWDVAGPPNPRNGHCVIGLGWNDLGVLFSTWGMLGTMTWAAVAKYLVPTGGGELHSAIAPDILIQGQNKTPAGVDWHTLIEDADALGANIPLPPPNPAPVPTPPVPGTKQRTIIVHGNDSIITVDGNVV